MFSHTKQKVANILLSELQKKDKLQASDGGPSHRGSNTDRHRIFLPSRWQTNWFQRDYTEERSEWKTGAIQEYLSSRWREGVGKPLDCPRSAVFRSYSKVSTISSSNTFQFPVDNKQAGRNFTRDFMTVSTVCAKNQRGYRDGFQLGLSYAVFWQSGVCSEEQVNTLPSVQYDKNIEC